jgi:hypothetical protein
MTAHPYCPKCKSKRGWNAMTTHLKWTAPKESLVTNSHSLRECWGCGFKGLWSIAFFAEQWTHEL